MSDDILGKGGSSVGGIYGMSVGTTGPATTALYVALPSIRTVSGKVACEVKVTQAIQTKKIGQMMVVDNKNTLVELKVLLPTNTGSKLELQAGDSIYTFSSHLSTASWAKEVFEVDGLKFVLVPEDLVMLVKTKDKFKNNWYSTVT